MDFKDFLVSFGFDFNRLLDKNNNILVYYDPDVDGVISGYFIQRYLESKYGTKNIRTHINGGREHGISLDFANELQDDLLIINVDSGLSLEVVDLLIAKGVDLISLDHHEVLDYFKGDLEYKRKDKGEFCLCNNQYTWLDCKDSYLSGAGVVFELLNTLDKKLVAELEFERLVGLTLLSDMRDIKGETAQKYLELTYSTVVSEFDTGLYYFFSLFRTKYDLGELYLDRNFIDYIIAPNINALLRMEGQQYILAAINSNTPNMWRQLYSVCQEAKSKQKELVNYAMENLVQRVHLSKSMVLVLVKDLTRQYSLLANCLGLIGNKFLTGDVDKVLILYVNDNGFVRGSFRARTSVDYLDEALRSGFDVAGHQNAFGFKSNKGLSKDDGSLDLENLMAFTKEVCKEDSLKGCTSVKTHDIASLPLGLKYLTELATKNQYKMVEDFEYGCLSEQPYSVVVDYAKEGYSSLKIDGVVIKAFEYIDTLDFNKDNYLIEPILKSKQLNLFLRQK